LKMALKMTSNKEVSLLRDVDELDVQVEENEKVYRYAVQYLGRSNGKDVLKRCYLGLEGTST